MKHAGKETLDTIEPLLTRIREFRELKEKHRGVFYCKSKAYLHFHEDPQGIFADVAIDRNWERFLLDGKSAEDTLIKCLEAHLSKQPRID